MSEKRAVVVGAGLVGSLWTILLAKRGYEVTVYEKRSDMRNAGFRGGRSINLAMSDRGWKAMEQAGIFEEIRSIAIPMKGRMMHSTEGELTYQAYGKEDQAIYSVSRGGLNLRLLELADEFPNVSLNFDQACEEVDLRDGVFRFRDTHTDAVDTVETPLLFGTDGAFSAVRGSMQRVPRFNYSQHYLPHGYKELTIPPAADGSHRIEKNALHIWPRGNFMLIALPNQDGSFTCTLFLPFEGKESFENLQTDAEITAFFEKHFPDTLPLMPDLVSDFRDNPTSALVTVRCFPWQYDHRVLLLGDASHAIVPFYGQGMNSGFEDCTILSELVDTYDNDWDQIIPLFNSSRPQDANAIADLALRNFVEMRDQVADPRFLLRKKIEAYLHEKYPEKFLAMYSMVTFSHLPYSLAWQEGQAQDQLFEQILAIPDIEKNWETNPRLEEVFKTWLRDKERMEPLYAKPKAP